MERLGRSSSTACFSLTRSIAQSAISRKVRLQPSHQPVVDSIRQMPLQGLGGWCIARNKHRWKAEARAELLRYPLTLSLSKSCFFSSRHPCSSNHGLRPFGKCGVTGSWAPSQ